jgi:hypothetical protein
MTGFIWISTFRHKGTGRLGLEGESRYWIVTPNDSQKDAEKVIHGYLWSKKPQMVAMRVHELELRFEGMPVSDALAQAKRMRAFAWRATFTHRAADGRGGNTLEVLIITRTRQEKEAEKTLRQYIKAKGEILDEIHDLELDEDRALLSPSFLSE